MLSDRGVFARRVPIAVRDRLSVSCQKESCAARMLRCSCIDDALTWASAFGRTSKEGSTTIQTVSLLWCTVAVTGCFRAKVLGPFHPGASPGQRRASHEPPLQLQQ